MIKPIFLVGLPTSYENAAIEKIQKNIQGKLNDYHVLVYPSINVDFDFKCFFEKDFEDVKFEELKEMVIKSIQKGEG